MFVNFYFINNVHVCVREVPNCYGLGSGSGISRSEKSDPDKTSGSETQADRCDPGPQSMKIGRGNEALNKH
jgi:hypothetical protein